MREVGVSFIFFLPSILTLVAACGSPSRPISERLPEGGAAGSTTTTGEGGAGEGGAGEGGSAGKLIDVTGGGSAGSGLACDGVCRETNPAWFGQVTMFWLGPSAQMPPCPAFAPLEGSVGYADPIAPHACAMCSCAPAACAIPEQMRVSAAACPGDGAPSIEWNTPDWDGACTASGSIPPGLMCGGVPCAQSLTIDAPFALAPCEPVEEGEESKTELSWGLLARECKIGPLTGEGCLPGEACAVAPPDGFSLCVHRDGDEPAFECPASYPRRYVVHAGYADERSCEPCACSAPECAALVSVYTKEACGVELASATVAIDQPACVDLPSGAGLASKAAAWVEPSPGSCAPSGGPSGGIVMKGPVTLCCEQGPEPPS